MFLRSAKFSGSIDHLRQTESAAHVSENFIQRPPAPLVEPLSNEGGPWHDFNAYRECLLEISERGWITARVRALVPDR